jgi:putative ABC transport system substrate-binding protein
MRRREFITMIGGAVAAWPLAARAQQADRMRRIGVLMGVPQADLEGQRWMRKFIQTLRDEGWKNGTNVQIDLRFSRDVIQMRTFGKELIDLQPDVIHVTTGIATGEVVRQTSTIPVVFSRVNDPVALGFVDSLMLPGRNATGITNIEPSLPDKWLGLLKEIAPRISHVTALFNPATAYQLNQRWGQLEAAAAALGLKIEQAPVASNGEIENAIAALAEIQAGLIMIPDKFFNLPRTLLIITQAARHRVPAIYPFRDFVDAGGLASYAVDLPDLQRRGALRRSHLEGAHAGGVAGTVADQIRACHQCQDGQGTRHHHPAEAVGSRRRGDQIILRARMAAASESERTTEILTVGRTT